MPPKSKPGSSFIGTGRTISGRVVKPKIRVTRRTAEDADADYVPPSKDEAEEKTSAGTSPDQNLTYKPTVNKEAPQASHPAPDAAKAPEPQRYNAIVDHTKGLRDGRKRFFYCMGRRIGRAPTPEPASEIEGQDAGIAVGDRDEQMGSDGVAADDLDDLSGAIHIYFEGDARAV
ncbi:hypothetical protein LTR53_015667 [Teratosphaeriaceae sp. CCFEE 6253]|nr:hypothetical protein LTR53_015667 [Teratosphaeriaceae sp. CCFEE 6253]